MVSTAANEEVLPIAPIAQSGTLDFECPKVFPRSYYFQATETPPDNITGLVVDNSLFVDTTTSSQSLSRSMHTMHMAGTVVYGALWPTIIFVGVVGNLLTLVVLRKIRDSSATSRLLAGLAVSDIITLVILCAHMVIIWGQLFWPDYYLTWKINSFTFLLLARFSERISKYITMVIVLERIVAITWPFRYKSIFTARKTSVCVAVIFLIMISTSFPISMDVFIYDSGTKAIGSQFPSVAKDARLYIVSRVHNSSIRFIHVIFNHVCFDFLPIPIVFVGNIIIITSMRKNRFTKNVSREVQRQRISQESHITKVLLTVSMLFLILCGPSEICSTVIVIGFSQIDYSSILSI